MDLQELRYRLTLYPASAIARASGISAGTIRTIRKNPDYQPSEATAARLVMALNSFDSKGDRHWFNGARYRVARKQSLQNPKAAAQLIARGLEPAIYIMERTDGAHRLQAFRSHSTQAFRVAV